MPDIILGIQHVGLTVSNIDEALTWFREVLGFKELFREDPMDIDNEYWAEALGVPIGSRLEASVLIGCGAGIELCVSAGRVVQRDGQIVDLQALHECSLLGVESRGATLQGNLL